MTFDGRTATTLVMLLVFAGASALAATLPSKAAFMPLLVGIPGTLLCAWQLVADLRNPRAPAPAPSGETGGQTEGEALLWLAIFTGVLVGFGFLVGAPLIVTLYVRFASHERWRNALFAGAGTAVVMFGVFHWLLELSLFEGLILEWLF